MHAADSIESTSFLKLQSVLTLYPYFVGCWTCSTCSTCCGDPSTCCRTSSDGAHMAGCVYIGNSIVCKCRCSCVTVNASMLFTDEYRVVPRSRNWQVETADWNLDVRLDI